MVVYIYRKGPSIGDSFRVLTQQECVMQRAMAFSGNNDLIRAYMKRIIYGGIICSQQKKTHHGDETAKNS